MAGQIIYVDADARGRNDGMSWGNAYEYLQDALAQADSVGGPVEVRVARGIYRPDCGAGITRGDRTATFALINGVTIKGGYAGFSKPQPDARDFDAYETVLSGDLDGEDTEYMDDPLRKENSYHVVTGSHTDSTAVLDGFTITAGYANGFGNPNDSGGGMYVTHGSPKIINCTFSRNAAVYAGAVADRDKCGTTLLNCTFVGNSVHSSGAAIFDWNSHGTQVVNCTFKGNFGRYGAAIRVYAGSTTLTDCRFSGNFAREQGGALYVEWSSVKLTNCTIAGNTAGIFHGGGIYNHRGGSTLDLTNCIFWNNSDTEGIGEASQIYGGTPIVNNCCIQGWTGMWGGSGNTGAVPMFVRSPYDGGDGWGVGNRKEFGDLLSVGANDDFGDLRLRQRVTGWD